MTDDDYATRCLGAAVPGEESSKLWSDLAQWAFAQDPEIPASAEMTAALAKQYLDRAAAEVGGLSSAADWQSAARYFQAENFHGLSFPAALRARRSAEAALRGRLVFIDGEARMEVGPDELRLFLSRLAATLVPVRAPDLSRWSDRLTRRFGLSQAPDATHAEYWTAFLEQSREARGVRSSAPGRVPSFKLQDLGRWVLSSGECSTIAQALSTPARRTGPEERWIGWLTARRQGCEVEVQHP